METSRLTQDGTAKPVSRGQILRRERGQGNIISISPVQLTTCRIGSLTRSILTLAICDDHTYILYTYYINRHAGTPSKAKTNHTMSPDYSSIRYVGFRIGWVSTVLYYHITTHQASYYYRLTDKARDKVLLSDNDRVEDTRATL